MDNVALAGMIGLPQLLLILIALGAFIFWIKTIIEIVQSNFIDNSKVTWLIVVILFGLLGAVIYHVAGRSNRNLEPEDSFDTLD